MYDSKEVSRIAKEMLSQSGVSPREAAIASGLHRATIYSILGGDKVGVDTLNKFSAGIKQDGFKLLSAAGYASLNLIDPDINDIVVELSSAKHLKKSSIEEVKRLVREIIARDEANAGEQDLQ
jgi:hypothetical protein